jgi:penicillin-binding protein 1A
MIKLLKLSIVFVLTGAAVGMIGLIGLYVYIKPQLPDIKALDDVRYHVPMSIYSRDGMLMAQFGENKRNPIGIAQIPAQLIHAVLAAEDDRFFDHPGVDYRGLLRAALEFARTGEKRQGGSTITMQVARNFFLTSEKTFLRKLKEIFLAIRIEFKLTKQRILELYLNQIYFGHHAYGIAAAAQVYYGKPVNELKLSQLAMIAGLPKAPSTFNPITDPERALTRRNYVLTRMLKLNYISNEEYRLAVSDPVEVQINNPYVVELNAPYVTEMVRNQMFAQYGEGAYVSGYKVFTTVDSRLQNAAAQALFHALHAYDERHGFRGVKKHVKLEKSRKPEERDRLLDEIPRLGDTLPGIILSMKDRAIQVYLGKSRQIEIPWTGFKWAGARLTDPGEGKSSRPAKMKEGDVIRVRQTSQGKWKLAQVPEAEGAIVSLNPTDGAILALVGGFDFALSKFNRATQTQRQPGSGFKPVIYTAALERGFTPASVINDAPIVFNDGSLQKGEWRPQNYSGRFYGPTRLRVALAKSRNLVSIRLTRQIGIDNVIDLGLRFGFKPDDLPRDLSLALGSGTASPLKMAVAYAVFANGGFKVEPYLIDRIETLDGKIVFQANPPIACQNCIADGSQSTNPAPRIISPQTHYLMNSMLQDVIRHGTAKRALKLGRTDLAGKTGTTNDQRDAWFNGYTPSLVAVSWIGRDSSKPLGNKETGGHAALPMWIHYMREALKGVPERDFEQPSGLTTVQINPATGLLAPQGSANAIFETVQAEQLPKRAAPASSTSAKPGVTDDDSGETQLQSLF